MQVHDELVLEVREDFLEQAIVEVRARMSSAAQLRVPLKVDVGSGRNWTRSIYPSTMPGTPGCARGSQTHRQTRVLALTPGKSHPDDPVMPWYLPARCSRAPLWRRFAAADERLLSQRRAWRRAAELRPCDFRRPRQPDRLVIRHRLPAHRSAGGRGQLYRFRPRIQWHRTTSTPTPWGAFALASWPISFCWMYTARSCWPNGAPMRNRRPLGPPNCNRGQCGLRRRGWQPAGGHIGARVDMPAAT